MPYGLSANVLQQLISVFEQNPQTEEAVLFGSRAKGNFREGSDIDIALTGQDLTINALKKLELKINDLLLPYEVNLVLYDSITNSDLTEHIDRAGIRIYKKQEQRQEGLKRNKEE